MADNNGRRRGVFPRATIVLLLAAVAVGWVGSVRPAAAAGKGSRASGKGPGASASAGAKNDARAQAKAMVDRAQVDYKLGRFQDALDGYRRAYELFQAPVLLFDIGQCHRNLGDLDKAIFFFEGYLREEDRPDPERRSLTTDLIAELRTEVQRQRAAAAVAAAPARAEAPPPRPVRPRIRLQATDDIRPGSTSLVARAPQGSPEPPAQHRSIASRWWFWTAIGGACALATGAAIYYATGEPRVVPPSGSIGTISSTSTGASP
ncbi:MAG TPA: tetratricopeptide repeat protein [Polyangia bacterium]|nr:tetratricopeptide repeat protein [Polyangia bacterium]